MKQEELLKLLVNELFKMDTLHQEYQDNDTHYVVDSIKEGNTLTIKVQLIKNKDKEEFEQWLENVDDELLEEVLENLGNVQDLNQLYETEHYKEVIDKVKSTTKEIASKKIENLQKLLN